MTGSEDEERNPLRRPRAATVGSVWISERPDGPIGDWVLDLPGKFHFDDYRVVDESDSGIAWLEPDPVPIDSPGLESRDHRSGTCFENESEEMRGACLDPLKAHLGTDMAIHEVRHQRSGYHTDLVYADVDGEAVLERARMVNSQEPLHDPLQRFKVWWYVHEAGPRPWSQVVENGLYTDPSKNRQHLDWLVTNGYVARSETNHVTALRPPKIAELHAVELKLRDWKAALDQAARANRNDADDRYLRYKPVRACDRWGYADYRWVALDAGAIDRALSHADRFRDRGVGLLAIAEGGAVVEHIEAAYELRERYTRDRAWVESEVWEQLDLTEWLSSGDEESDSAEDTRSQTPLAAFKTS